MRVCMVECYRTNPHICLEVQNDQKGLFQKLELQEACKVLYGSISRPVRFRYDPFILHSEKAA